MTERKDWCKIFDTAHGPVLFWAEYDHEEESDVLHQQFKHPVCMMDTKLSGFNGGELTQEQWDEGVTQEVADKYAAGCMSMFPVEGAA